MPFDLGHAFIGLLVPENLPSVSIDTENVPGVLGGIIDRADIAVVADADLLIGLAADGGRQEDVIAPHYRT